MSIFYDTFMVCIFTNKGDFYTVSAQKIKNAFLFMLVFLLVFSISAFLIFLGQKKSENPSSESTEAELTEKASDTPVIIIDAGHGGEDGGATGVDGTLEKELNLSVATELAELFGANGYQVRLTRDTDILLYDRNSDYYGHKKEQDMSARLAICNEYENAIFISIHMNSFSESKYKGLQVYHSPLPSSACLAEKIQSAVVKNLQSDNNREIKSSDGNIYLLDNNIHPAVLVECGFLSNPEDCSSLSDKNYRSRLCLTIFFAVKNYIDSSD